MESHSGRIHTAICPSCNGGNEKNSRFCVHCGYPLLKKRGIRFTSRTILLGAMGLILAGTISYFVLGGPESKLIGKVNGEGVTRKEEAKAKGLEYYEKKIQKKGASARVTSLGCNIQVDIIEDGKVVAFLTYNQGEILEI